MGLLFLALIVLAPASTGSPAGKFDAATAAPASHRVLMEDAQVRVLRVEVAPGATEPVHAHPWASVMYFEQPQPLTYKTYKLVAGRPVETERVDVPAFPVGETVRGQPEGLHSVTNRGLTPFVAIRIEFKGKPR